MNGLVIFAYFGKTFMDATYYLYTRSFDSLKSCCIFVTQLLKSL